MSAATSRRPPARPAGPGRREPAAAAAAAARGAPPPARPACARAQPRPPGARPSPAPRPNPPSRSATPCAPAPSGARPPPPARAPSPARPERTSLRPPLPLRAPPPPRRPERAPFPRAARPAAELQARERERGPRATGSILGCGAAGGGGVSGGSLVQTIPQGPARDDHPPAGPQLPSASAIPGGPGCSSGSEEAATQRRAEPCHPTPSSTQPCPQSCPILGRRQLWTTVHTGHSTFHRRPGPTVAPVGSWLTAPNTHAPKPACPVLAGHQPQSPLQGAPILRQDGKVSPSPHPVDEPKETAFLLATGVDLHSPPLGTPAPGGLLLATFPASCFQASAQTLHAWAALISPGHSALTSPWDMSVEFPPSLG
ncbi:basic proline-rich protein-like [Bos indicus x Bos taurus]|uniref:basic proline-rich protein-like n=1 Tax=Bos indicus x Bos taurus TaxID=30522 RepID=UPI000F7D40A9|nr:basic proline-rich protein-like [Bos indicus x Bos taurus]